MRRHLLLLAALIMVTDSSSAEDLVISEIIHYTGTIGNVGTSIVLEQTNNSVRGNLRYINSDDSPIMLAGSLKKQNINLKALRDNSVTARIKAEIKDDGMIDGTWEGEERHQIQIAPSSKSFNETIIDIGLNGTSLIVMPKNGPEQIIPISVLTDSVSVVFEDFTFDGYADMRILELEAGGNSSYIYFEYLPSANAFVKARAEISNLTNPLVIHGKKLITGLIKDGCCRYSATIVDAGKTYSAEYDYLSESGKEIITDSASGLKSQAPITKQVFEENYLTVIQKGNL